MMRFQSVTVVRSYEQVVRQICDRIRAGELLPGQKLPTEQALSESFGVSRAVIREAIKVLVSLGMVESRQGSGTYVAANPIPSISRALTLSATPDEDSVLRLFEVREPLETTAARLAALRRADSQIGLLRQHAAATASAAAADDVVAFGAADHAFHRAVAEAAGNAYLAVIISAVRELQSDAVALIVRLAGSMAVAAEQHARIAEAIAGCQAEEAAQAMADHVRYSADAAREILSRPPAEREWLTRYRL
ncbi:MAG: FadR family transcriptional regulator [Chloroflexota bacterium]